MKRNIFFKDSQKSQLPWYIEYNIRFFLNQFSHFRFALFFFLSLCDCPYIYAQLLPKNKRSLHYKARVCARTQLLLFLAQRSGEDGLRVLLLW